jgi:epoxyqueuosine reductase
MHLAADHRIEHARLIKAEAARLGFLFCGVSEAGFLEEEAPRLERWLKGQMHGQMGYMADHFDKRLDPRLLVPGARSIITVLLNYYPERTQTDPGAPRISKYAYGEDYHFVIKDRLRELADFIRQNIGEVDGRAFVDSAPVMDKAWSRRSGAGWMGRNTNLIRPRVGSFFFIGELILDLPLAPDGPMADHCGTCTDCIDACPTEAITEPYVVDGSKCISYFTIELKGSIPEGNEKRFGDWAFGCDICQDVCPWNRFATPHAEPRFNPHPKLLDMQEAEWRDISEEVFREVFRRSAVKRTRYEGLRRNLRYIGKA